MGSTVLFWLAAALSFALGCAISLITDVPANALLTLFFLVFIFAWKGKQHESSLRGLFFILAATFTMAFIYGTAAHVMQQETTKDITLTEAYLAILTYSMYMLLTELAFFVTSVFLLRQRWISQYLRERMDRLKKDHRVLFGHFKFTIVVSTVSIFMGVSYKPEIIYIFLFSGLSSAFLCGLLAGFTVSFPANTFSQNKNYVQAVSLLVFTALFPPVCLLWCFNKKQEVPLSAKQ